MLDFCLVSSIVTRWWRLRLPIVLAAVEFLHVVSLPHVRKHVPGGFIHVVELRSAGVKRYLPLFVVKRLCNATFFADMGRCFSQGEQFDVCTVAGCVERICVCAVGRHPPKRR